MKLKSAILVLLILAMLTGAASAAESKIVAGDFSSQDGVVTIPIQIVNAQNLGFLKAVATVNSGSVSIRQSSMKNTMVNSTTGTFVWYGNYEDGNIDPKTYNQQGYSNTGTVTLFYLDVSPGSSKTTVTVTFNEIWNMTSDQSQIPLYLSNGGKLVLDINGGSEPGDSQATVTYVAGVEGATAPAKATVKKGDLYTITSRRPIAKGYVFISWSLDGERVTTPTIQVLDNITLCAMWYERSSDFDPTFADLGKAYDYFRNRTEGDEIKWCDFDGSGRVTFVEVTYLAQYMADHVSFD